MNKRDNPYTPGAGRKPRTLAGREEDLDAFEALVERLESGSHERSLVYTGLRRVGKTVLLMEFDVLASEAGWATNRYRRGRPPSPTSASPSPAWQPGCSRT